MKADLECVTLDCPEPRRLAAFYRSLTGGTLDRPDPRWALGDAYATLHLPSGLVLAFQRVDGYRAPHWPDAARPQQLHLDFGVGDLAVAHRQALAHGAVLLDDGPENGGVWRVYADPAGHPFCLVQRRPPPVASSSSGGGEFGQGRAEAGESRGDPREGVR
jgi:catechol 2,3-dioxygenase-like lactoylglutathione lyase family enzyme